MNRDRWEIVNRIFHDALEVEAGQRDAFVFSASQGDVELQMAVSTLLHADQEAGSYLESPLVDETLTQLFESPVETGHILCDRFRIIRSIAQGGMGHVFEALDTELNVRIALKVIRPEIATDPEALVRFRQEVRLARTITHPNVCRTFDIDRDTRVLNPQTGSTLEVAFLTMELLPGETLAARIKRDGPLPLEEALRLASQVADALSAAHSLGIVHRDMKPANIILAPVEGNAANNQVRAVVTDFGLARQDPLRRVSDHSSFSQTARPIGTLAYMAPEQLEGAPVSPSTDIYAFGLILFEMVTGTRAFPSENVLTGLSRRLTGPPPSPASIVPGLPAAWSVTIEDCLRIKPAERPKTANDVVAALGGRRTRRSLSRKSTYVFPRRILGICALVFVSVALTVIGLRLYQSRTDSKVTPGATVYLTPVKNETGEKSFDNLTELIKVGLAQSTQINLLDQARVDDMLQQMTKSPDTTIDAPIAREIAMRSGAVRVVFASVSKSGNSYRLKVEVQQPDYTPMRSRNRWENVWTWTPTVANGAADAIDSETLARVRDASDWIRHQIGESSNDIARFDAPPEEATTSDWGALAAFTEAESLFARAKPEEAVNVLHDATERDSQFALAEAFEGDILANLGRTQQAYDIYQKALEDGSNGRLSLRERDRIKGIVAHDTGDEQAAEVAYREYTLFYENDYDGWFRRARPLLMLGRTQDSIHALERAHKVDPTKPAAVVQLVRGALVSEDLASAHRWLQEMEKSYSRDWYLFALGPTQVIERDYSGASQSFTEMTNSEHQNLRWLGYSFLADLRAEQGRFSEAVEVISRSLEIEPGSADALIDRAALYCRLGQLKRCTDDIDGALETDPAPRIFISASSILGRFAGSFPGTQGDAARRELDALGKRLDGPNYGVISGIARHRVRGEILLANGNPGGAVVEFRKAVAMDAPFKPREYLARALLAKAAREGHNAVAESMVQEATQIYSEVALRPAVVWQFPQPYPPGFYADQLESWLHLSQDTPQSQRESMLHLLSLLRPSPTPSLHAGELH